MDKFVSELVILPLTLISRLNVLRAVQYHISVGPRTYIQKQRGHSLFQLICCGITEYYSKDHNITTYFRFILPVLSSLSVVTSILSRFFPVPLSTVTHSLNRFFSVPLSTVTHSLNRRFFSSVLPI